MPSLHHRIATMGPLPAPPVLALRDAQPSATTDADVPTSTIAPFAYGLAGVAQKTNMLFKDSLWWTLGIMALMCLAVRIVHLIFTWVRQVSSMNNQPKWHAFWRTSQPSWMANVKKHFLYAPLWNKRHNREIKLSSAIGMGTLPSRMHTVILVLYVLSNFVYMCYVNFEKKNHFALIAEVRGRSGTLSLVNMVPLVLFAGRNNPLISVLGISFDTYNLLHRWMGRLVVVEAIVHTVAWMYVQYYATSWQALGHIVVSQAFEGSGFAGTIALILILFLSFSPLRHAFYETFLNVHIILGLFTFGMTWVHCASAEIPGGLPQLPWIIGIVIVWVLERLARMFRLAYNNWSRKGGFTEAIVEPMPGEVSRVTLHLPRYLDVGPGTHAYLRFADVKPWESHPFSIIWVDHHPKAEKEQLAKKDLTHADYVRGTTSVSFVIGAHTGFTRSLYSKACSGGGPSIRLRAAMEGPYAGHHSLESYGHVVLVAGATGITHQLSYIKPLIEGFNEGTVATRRITLVWVMRDTESMHWVRPWMDEILKMPRRREILGIRLFITRPKNSKEVHSPSSTVQMFPGRPNIPTLIKKEVEEQIGAMCVTVCGPGALADDVRQAVRSVQDERSVVDFQEESFTW